MLYVYTSILNGFDNLRPPATPHDDPGKVRYICFTNIPNLPRVHPWEYRPAYIATGNPARDSRIPKILPHLMLPADATASIYHDGNFQLRQDPAAIVNLLLADHNWSAHRHPCRNCIYDEADILLRERIGTKELVAKDIALYKDWGHPENAGLWANGMIVRKHTDRVALLNEKWWQLFQDGCERDQISFPVARVSIDLPVKTIESDIFSSPYLLFRWHAAWRDREDNPDFWRQRDQIRNTLEALKIATLSNGNIIHHEY